jgi:hypothetical protein
MVKNHKETYNRDQFWGAHRMAILRSSAVAIGKSVVGCWSGTKAVVSVRTAPWAGLSRFQEVGLRCG